HTSINSARGMGEHQDLWGIRPRRLERPRPNCRLSAPDTLSRRGVGPYITARRYNECPVSGAYRYPAKSMTWGTRRVGSHPGARLTRFFDCPTNRQIVRTSVLT